MASSMLILEIGQRVRQLRSDAGGPCDIDAFARRLGVAPAALAACEAGQAASADLLLRIARHAPCDLRWLLTGAAGTVPADHPSVTRLARHLAGQDVPAAALAAFVDVLEATLHFPPVRQQEALSVAAPALQVAGGPPALPDRPADPLAFLPFEPPEPEAPIGWIPILGRSAAGVPQFWKDRGEDAGVTHLADLVRRVPPAPHRHSHPAEAFVEGGAEVPVQIVTVADHGPPGTCEFLLAETLWRCYDRAFAVRIDGQSMEPQIHHGDLVVLSPIHGPEDGRAAVVQLAGQIGVTCKRFRREGGRVHLIPANETFPATDYPAEQVVWALRVLALVRPRG